MNSKKIIKSNLAPKAIGAYSQGVLIDNIIFTSGQIPINPNNNQLVSEDFKMQAIQVLNNIKNLIESEGASINNLIKLTVYLTDLSNFDILNKVFEDFFEKDFPARSVVQVVKLPKNSKIEIDAICLI